MKNKILKLYLLLGRKQESKHWIHKKPFQIYYTTISQFEWVTIINRIKYPVRLKTLKNSVLHYHKSLLKNRISGYLNYSTKIEALSEHSSYVQYLYDQEKKRQDNLDSKAKQIITNISLFFSIVAFSSILIFNKENFDVLLSTWSIIIIAIAILLAGLSLFITLLTLDLQKYSRPKQEYIFKKENYSDEDFLRYKIHRFISCTENNSKINNKKSQRIRLASRIFLISMLFVGVFTILNLLTLNRRNIIQQKKTSFFEQHDLSGSRTMQDEYSFFKNYI
jgi:hypothetical protein